MSLFFYPSKGKEKDERKNGKKTCGGEKRFVTLRGRACDFYYSCEAMHAEPVFWDGVSVQPAERVITVATFFIHILRVEAGEGLPAFLIYSTRFGRWSFT